MIGNSFLRRLRNGLRNRLRRLQAKSAGHALQSPSLRAQLSKSALESWLVETELKYGGRITNVSRNKVSPKDPRTPEQLAAGGMIGGDRMSHHGYAEKYAEYLLPFVRSGKRVTLAEFGILKGTGLAIWSALFPGSRIIGFDIDLGHIRSNMANLKGRGAFSAGDPEVHEYDQFLDNRELLASILGDDRIDVYIDDGFHSIETIMMTLHSARPFLADRFIAFIEDNSKAHKEIRSSFPTLPIESCGQFTIISGTEGAKA